MIRFKSKQRYTEQQVTTVLAALERAVEQRLVRRWNERGQHTRAAYRGTGDPVSQKWNVKIYRATARGAAIVCVDHHVLDQLVNHDGQTLLRPSDRPVVSIDDSGWGFPLCGVMVGCSDGERVETAVVPVSFFRDPYDFQVRKRYLVEYARLGMELLDRLGCSADDHRIEICTGYVNSRLKDRLREAGYETRVVEIQGLLQDRLEAAYREHVAQRVGRDLYYDPKELPRQQVPRAYHEAVRYGRRHCPDLLKTGWKALGGAVK